MAQTFTDRLTHAVCVVKPFLRPCGAFGVVVPPDPGLLALGYFPTPLRGLSHGWSTLPRAGRPGLLSTAPAGLRLWKEIRKGVAA